MLALAEYEAECHDCGFHWSLLNDTTNIFRPEWRTCPVCRGSARVQRMQDAHDRQWRDQNKDNPHAPDPADGRHMVMRLLPAHEADGLRSGQSQSRGGRSS